MTAARRLHVYVFLTILLFLSPLAYSQAEGPDSRDTLRLDQVQFKATHNSYYLKHAPNVLIDEYDVWEIELDFGMKPDGRTLLVGHDYADKKHGCTTLGDWVRNVLTAKGLMKRPLILKLEAKTTGPCEASRFQSFTCADNWPEKWQAMLVDSLNEWIGPENWVTYRKFRDDLDGQWPKVSALAGKFLITLQDSNDDRDIDRQSDHFFIREIPGLRAVWPPIKNADEYRAALQSGANRLTMDGAYESVGTVRPEKQ